MFDYTLVLGVDSKHLKQLQTVWPTWWRHKPSLMERPLVVFTNDVSANEIRNIIRHDDCRIVSWPPPGIVYAGDHSDKWTNPQRHKMLAGFVYVPATYATTKYWLKIDTDVVATGMDDWIDGSWFDGGPAIVAHPWGLTKPANQMLLLDEWAFKVPQLAEKRPLNLAPIPGEEQLCHKRICSWCAFFDTEFTKIAACYASTTCGDYQLPVASQDGYLWYVATRMGAVVRRVRMKARGWKLSSTWGNIVRSAQESLNV